MLKTLAITALVRRIGNDGARPTRTAITDCIGWSLD